MENSDNLFIGNNIRKWRIMKGFKQFQFAKHIDISTTTLSKIENGQQKVNLPRLQQIAEGLKIKTTQLFKDPSDWLP